MKRMTILLLTVMLALAGMKPVLAQENGELAGAEQQAMADTLQYSLENSRTNQASDWVNPDTGRSGAVVPTRTFENAQGQPCREFISSIIIGGKEEQGYGTACRQPDGSWQIVNDQQPTQTPPPPTNVYIYNPPENYYAYPSGFYGPYHIYLSFGYIYRSGHLHRGTYFLNGPSFRHRYPLYSRERVFIGPRFFSRYRLQDELRYRQWENRRERQGHRGNRWPNPDRSRDDHRRGHR